MKAPRNGLNCDFRFDAALISGTQTKGKTKNLTSEGHKLNNNRPVYFMHWIFLYVSISQAPPIFAAIPVRFWTLGLGPLKASLRGLRNVEILHNFNWIQI